MWVILPNNAGWDCFSIPILLEILRIQNRLMWRSKTRIEHHAPHLFFQCAQCLLCLNWFSPSFFCEGRSRLSLLVLGQSGFLCMRIGLSFSVVRLGLLGVRRQHGWTCTCRVFGWRALIVAAGLQWRLFACHFCCFSSARQLHDCHCS